jgi:hypothetical protein
MRGKWRLLGKTKLFNIEKDPHQDKNVYKEHPEIAESMTAYYDKWYEEARKEFEKPRYITIGTKEANPIILYASDWQGDYCDNRGGLLNAKGKGYYELIVEQEGTYEIELRRWPKESGKTLTEAFDDKKRSKRTARPIAKAQLKVADFNKTIDTKPEDKSANFSVELKAGKVKLTPNLLDKDGKILCGAMYVYINRK